MVLMAALLLLIPSCKFMESINPFGKKARAMESLQKQQEAFRVADSIKVAAQKVEDEKARQAELEREAAEEQVSLVASTSKHHIIVGSFVNRAYAASWSDHCRGMGYDANIIEWNDGRWNLVSAKSFATLRGAYDELPTFMASFDMQAWVLAGR